MPTQFQATSKGISGAIAGETSSTSIRFLISNLISMQFRLFAICLSFSSPPLHKNLPFYSPSFSFAIFSSDLFMCVILLAYLVTMSSTTTRPLSPDFEVFYFKQSQGENLKDAWYRLMESYRV